MAYLVHRLVCADNCLSAFEWIAWVKNHGPKEYTVIWGRNSSGKYIFRKYKTFFLSNTFFRPRVDSIVCNMPHNISTSQFLSLREPQDFDITWFGMKSFFLVTATATATGTNAILTSCFPSVPLTDVGLWLAGSGRARRARWRSWSARPWSRSGGSGRWWSSSTPSTTPTTTRWGYHGNTHIRAFPL